MSNLFISHSSRDSAAAKQLQARLEEQGHHSVFLDLDPEAGIQAGVSWERTLYTKLRACRAVVALCSDSYLASQWCFAEIALARMEGKELFVLQIDPWSENTQMPSILTEEQYIDLRTNQDDGYQRLWNGFKVKGIMAAEAREWKPEEPPYPGLRAFREEDAPIFFGRDEEIREGGELLNRVRRQGHPRLVMVLGSSGSGKSSLVRAGIVPQLRRDRGQWRVVKPFRPGRQPARELAASLSQAFDEAGQTFAWEEIHRWLEPAADGDLAAPAAVLPATAEAEPSPAAARERLLQALSAMEGELTAADDQVVSSVRRLKDYLGQQQTETPLPSGGAPPPPVASPLAELASRLRLQSGFAEATVVLVIDQFEELLGHDAKHPASRFLAMLRAAMETEDSPFLVIGTMRSDYLGVLQRSAPLQGFGFKSLSVGPLSRDGMRQIIEEPAKLGQIQLENGLSDLLLVDTETSDALPLLAFTLRMMWDRYRDKRLLEIREYKELGGLQGAVAQVADETLETALTLGEERDLRDAFLSLARPTAEGSGWARQATNWEDLAEQVRPMLQEFIDQRLLVKRADCTVEVAHEALFRSWEKLRGWLNANAEGLRLLHEIQIDAAKWETATMDREREPYLWRGGRLTRAVELRDAGVLALNDLNRSFIEASERSERERIDAETARQRRELRRTRIFAAFIAAALVVVVLGFFKIQRQARHTLSRQLAAQSHQLLDHQPDLALLIALAAGRVEKTLDAQRALLAAVQYNPRLWRYLHGPGDPIRSVAISADGSILAAVVEGDGGGGSILLWSVDNGLPLASSPLALPEMADPVAAFSPDGRWLAVGGVDRQEWEKGLLDLWDMGSDPPRRRDGPSPEGAVNDLAFCGQQKSILAWATKNRRVFLWRPDDDAERVSLLHKEIDIRRLAFAPDCTCLAVGHEETGSIDFIELGSTHLPETAAGEAPETRQGASTVCPKETLRGPNSEDRILTTQGSTQGVISLAFAPTGDAVAAARMDGTVDLWDLNSASCETLSEPAGPVEAVAYDSDRTLLSAGRDGAILLWNLRESPAASERLPGHAGKVTGLAYGRGGGLFASGGEDGKVILWKLDRRQRLANILKGHEDEVLAAAFDPDGGRLVSGGAGPTVKLWELDTGDWADLKGNTGVTSGVDFSSDGMLVVAGGEDGSLHLWHLGDEKKNLHWFAEGRRPVASVRFNPAESTLATAVDDQIVLWDFGVELSTPTPSEPTVLKPPLATHPADIWSLLYRDGGGSIVASDTGGGAVLVWNLKTRESRSFFPAHGSKEPVLTAIAQSANGNLLAAGGDDRCVHLWEMSGDKPSECLAGHELPVLAVAFGPGDRTLFSADRGGTLLVWDVASRQPLGGLRDGHESGKPINNLALGKRGNLASVADDKNIAIWDLDWQAVACDVARRDMKYEEWQVYLEDTARRNLCPVFDRTVPAASPNRRMRKQERRSE